MTASVYPFDSIATAWAFASIPIAPPETIQNQDRIHSGINSSTMESPYGVDLLDHTTQRSSFEGSAQRYEI